MKIETNLRKVTGVYKITNTINNKCYIGSAIDVYNRGSMYRHLVKRKKLHNKHLQYSIEKYGFNNFTFTLLERCLSNISIEELHKLEQHYINKLNPEYNKRNIVDTNHLLTHSQSTKDKISKRLKELYKNGDKVIIKEQEANIKISLFLLSGEHFKNFNSLSECAMFLMCTKQSVYYALRSKRHWIKNYLIIETKHSTLINKYVNIPRITYFKKVTILNIVTNECLEFNTCKLCSVFLQCKQETVKKYYDNKKIWKNLYKIIKYE